ncbi:MAG TPA: ATP-binding cassette domain-containing protein [Acidimicrobiia bacterium]|nr:ATP-binding cassette domain-containing protein [Acidimicrobiia bacterium]
MLQLCGLTVRFGPRTVLDDLSFGVPPGEVVGLLGPNGAGKTTAMRVVFGVVEPDAGEVRWDGRRADEADRATWGYMTQERGLYPDMRVSDQLVYFARLHGLDKTDALRRSRDLLDRLGLGDRADDVVDKLSGGMQQRVQLAASLLHDPPVVVLDEPFAGLDPVAVEHLSEVVTTRAAAGHTVIFSSHQLDLVEDLCQSIVMMHHGRVVLAGRVTELKAASGERQLRLRLDGHGAGEGRPPWLAGLSGVELLEAGPAGLRLRLDPGVDALAVLDAARAAGPVVDFGLEQPSLSQLFLRAVGDADPFGDGGADG